MFSHASSHNADVFWGEIRPCDHVVQIYEEEPLFMETLTGFVADGLRLGEATIVVATPPHRAALRNRLAQVCPQISDMRAAGQHVELDAADTLDQFMRNGWPDDGLFDALVDETVEQARRNSPTGRVRAFGEMVAVLWANGNAGATVHLEHLWHELCTSKDFALFCAYPRSGFTGDATESIQEICRAHHRTVGVNCFPG